MMQISTEAENQTNDDQSSNAAASELGFVCLIISDDLNLILS